MNIKIWVVQTCIPERGEKPCFPSVFASQAEAEAYAEERLIEEWRSREPGDEDGDPLPYPGNWRAANDAIAKWYDDGSWGRWEITCHDLDVAFVAVETEGKRFVFHTRAAK